MLDHKLLEQIKEYVHLHLDELIFANFTLKEVDALQDLQSSEIEDFIKNNRKPTLKEVLFGFIDQKGVSDAEIYKKAGLDRKHFSKIRSTPNYRPRKNILIALAFALELNKRDTDKLLNSAGYSLSESETYDLVIQFCLEKQIYDIDDVNQALDYFSLKPLTGL